MASAFTNRHRRGRSPRDSLISRVTLPERPGHGALAPHFRLLELGSGKIGSVFARYANLTLGGGSATTAVIHGKIVTRRRWVSEEQFALSFAMGRLTPGTNLLAFCVGIGWMLRRWVGAIVVLLAASILRQMIFRWGT